MTDWKAASDEIHRIVTSEAETLAAWREGGVSAALIVVARQRDEARQRIAVVEKELWDTRLEREGARAERDYFGRQTDEARGIADKFCTGLENICGAENWDACREIAKGLTAGVAEDFPWLSEPAP